MKLLLFISVLLFSCFPLKNVSNEKINLNYSLECSSCTPISIIYFTTPEKAHILIELFNDQEIKVDELMNETILSGFHQVVLDKYNLRKGNYVLCLSAKNEIERYKIEKNIIIN